MSEGADFGDLLARAAEAAGADWGRFVARLPAPVRRRMREEFFWQAHGGQVEPRACADGSEWRVWLLMAGRGFGKTRAGAEWVHARARENPGARIALVGGSRDEVAKVMVEGPSGLLAVARTGESPSWHPTQGVVRFTGGAEAFVYSAAAPEKLRGPEHHFGWADELAKWPQAEKAWDILHMGLRLGAPWRRGSRRGRRGWRDASRRWRTSLRGWWRAEAMRDLDGARTGRMRWSGR